jgi:hypothetical protein
VVSAGNTLEAKLAAIDAAEASDPRFYLPKLAIKALLGVGDTAAEDLLNGGPIDSVIVGNRRMGMKPSAYEYMRTIARASYEPDGVTPLKVRQPKSMFRKQPRPRTENELRGLAKGNEKRRLEAQQRRAAERRAAKESAPSPA